MNMMIKAVFISILSIMLSLVTLPTSALTNCGIVATQSGRLNIRSGPGKAWRVISRASKGSALSIVGIHDYWYRVKLNNGKIGYARIDYVSSGTCSIVATETGRLNIRSRPTQGSRVISKAAKGSALRILQWGTYWSKVKLNNGKIGYASMDYLE